MSVGMGETEMNLKCGFQLQDIYMYMYVMYVFQIFQHLKKS